MLGKIKRRLTEISERGNACRQFGRRCFEETGESYPRRYRDNDRLVFDDADLAGSLFDALRARRPAALVVEDVRGRLWAGARSGVVAVEAGETFLHLTGDVGAVLGGCGLSGGSVKLSTSRSTLVAITADGNAGAPREARNLACTGRLRPTADERPMAPCSGASLRRRYELCTSSSADPRA